MPIPYLVGRFLFAGLQYIFRTNTLVAVWTKGGDMLSHPSYTMDGAKQETGALTYETCELLGRVRHVGDGNSLRQTTLPDITLHQADIN